MTPINRTLCLLPLLFLVVDAGSSSYAPTREVPCPSNVAFVRTFPPSDQSIHVNEKSYIDARLSAVSQSWESWLGDGSHLGYDFKKFTMLPTVGIALSGGGERAALYGAGVLESLDGKNKSSAAAGTGGLLQTASYVTGLSGGSWLMASLTFMNYPHIRSLVMGDSRHPGWMLDLGLLAPDGLNLFSVKNQQYYLSVFSEIIEKEKVGFRTSITDVWAHFLSYHFLSQNHTTRENFFTNTTEHGAGILWSQIPQLEAFQNHSIPFPIVLTDSRPSWSHSAGLQTLDAPVFEITPFEMGSYDPSLSSMADITYAGTQLIDGRPTNTTACVTGFDQAGFILGTSSSAFNAIFDIARQRFSGYDPVAAGLLYWVRHRLSQAAQRRVDVANWPNPFRSSVPTNFRDYNSTYLDLVDGSENFANIPFGPLFLKARDLDVVVAVDGSSDSDNNFINGTSMLSTATRLRHELSQTHRQFPPIPADVQEMNRTGVVLRPTFFGCYPTQDLPEWPLVIYLPNSPPLNGDHPVTNTKTFKTSYTPKHVSMFLNQVHNLTVSGFTPGSQAPDHMFGRCLQCAAIDRARYKQATIPRSEFCSLCFERYCYDPEHPPSAEDIVGRIFDLKDPDPQMLALLGEYLTEHRRTLLSSSVTGLVLFFMFVILCYIYSNYWQKAGKARERAHYDAARDEDYYDPGLLSRFQTYPTAFSFLGWSRTRDYETLPLVQVGVQSRRSSDSLISLP